LADCAAKTELIDWVLENTDNSYLPFGSPNHGAKSLAEFQRITRDIEARVQAQRDAESARQLADQNRKAARATELIFNAIRRKDSKAVVALLDRGADRNAVDANGQTAEEYAQKMGLGGLFL
jgi:ankyrin repeat protein